MAKFRIEIELGNDEMKDGADIAYALRHVAALIEDRDEGGLEGVVGSIRDGNGNKVGTYKVTP